MVNGVPVELATAIDAARRLIDEAKRPVALVSSWGSNEELAAFKDALGGRFASFVKEDSRPAPGEPLEDNFLIRTDKNPNTAGARKLFGDAAPAFPEGTDLVLVWGEGCDFDRLPRGTQIIFLNAYLQPANARADVFLPVSIQTERSGHYTNFQGVVSAFEPCFPKPASVADAERLFAALGVAEGIRA
jgi:NADH-quinone oxidoreductase subunit G